MELLCTGDTAYAYVSVPSVIDVVREALAPGYPSGVCLPLHFAMFISVAAPVHALSSCW